jgi:polysaccharide biosynthesis/export protein
MSKVLWSAVFAILPVCCFAQDSKTQAPPSKPSTPAAVMSPKATIPSPPVEGSQPAPETKPEAPAADPAKMAVPGASAKAQNLAQVDEKTYVIGAEDGLHLLVWGQTGMSGTYSVRPDGRISIPLVGEFKASGKTPEELASEIAERMRSQDILRNPNVTIGLQEVRSKMIYISGEVNRPGRYPITKPTNVLQALVNAGGFKDFANQKNIVIQRGLERFKFNYKEVIQGKHVDQNILLQPEDHIIVK